MSIWKRFTWDQQPGKEDNIHSIDLETERAFLLI